MAVDGCISNLVKYLLFGTNFLIFVLGVAVLGCGIWVMVDKPSFLDLFHQAEDLLPAEAGNFEIALYTSATYIIIVIAVLAIIISFFGCCGAIKENKCMLGTYFVLVLALFIVMVVGAVLGYSGDIEKSVKDPLLEAMKVYDDTAAENNDPAGFAYKKIWNEVQFELQCCGVTDAGDWKTTGSHNFTASINKPEGCCHYMKEGSGAWKNIFEDKTAVTTCRKADVKSDMYHFKGCFDKIVEEIENNQSIVVGVAIGVVVVMFLNMLFAFAMCTMVS